MSKNFTESTPSFDEVSPTLQAVRSALFDGVEDPILVAEADTGFIVDCNRAAETFFGRQRSGLVGLHQSRLHPGDAGDDRTPDFAQAADVSTHLVEKLLKTAGGEFRWTSIKSSMFTIDGRRFVLGVFRDVDDQRRAHEAARDAAEMTRAIFDAVLDPVLAADAETGILVDCNQAAERYFGRPREELLGRPQRDLHPPEAELDEGFTRDFKHNILAPGLSETIPVLAAGGLRCCHINANSVEIKGKKRLIGVFHDVTEEQNVFEVLRESEARFRGLIEQSTDPIYVHDEQGRLKFVNQAACDALGYDAGELLALHVSAVDPDFVVHDHPGTLWRSLPITFSSRHRRKDGSLFPVEVRASRIVLGGEPLIHGLARDLTPRLAAKSDLDASKQRFVALVEQVEAVAVQGYTPDGTITYWNPASTKLYGWTAEEAVGTDLVELLFPESGRAAFRAAVVRMIESGRPVPACELGLLHKDGRPLSVLSSHVVVARPGQAPELYCLDIDLAEIKRVEQALRESEQTFKRLFDKSPVGAAVVGLDLRFKKVNETLCALTGYTESELLAMRIPEITHPDDVKADYARAKQLIDGEIEHFVREKRYIRKDGETVWVEVYVRLNRDESGAPLHFMPVMFDVSEKKRVLARLTRESTRNAALVRIAQAMNAGDADAASVAAAVLEEAKRLTDSPYGLVAAVNAETGDVASLAANDLTQPGAPLAANVCFSLPKIEGRFPGLCGAALTSWQGFFVNDAKSHPAFGGLPSSHAVIERFLAVPVLLGDALLGQIALAGAPRDYGDEDVATVRSLAELFALVLQRIKAVEALERAKEAAEAGGKAKSEFLANMSHDIRTPLNGVLGMLQLLKFGGPSPEQKELIDTALKSSNRLSRLLSDILDLSKIEANKLSIIAAPFSPEEMRRTVLDLFSNAAAEKGLLLEFVLSPELPKLLLGDEARIRQVLFNLVGNAVKFSERGRVLVEIEPVSSATAGESKVLLSVSDEGVGVPPDRLRDVFEPFTQVDGSYVRRHQGAGLGLAIVRRITQLMGGGVLMESEEGVGTDVHVLLPLKPAKAAPNLVVRETRPVKAQQTALVLLVEDDGVNRLAMSRLLEKLGHRTLLAVNGLEAISALRDNPVDLVLMDIQMPVMDGVEATKAIRAGAAGGAKGSVPIAAITAYAMSGDREKFLAAGMSDYIAKPVDMDRLRKVVKRALAG